MAPTQQLPCDGEGFCMSCKAKPGEGETLTCKTCVTPWHVDCLTQKPESMSDVATWECPDCTFSPDDDNTHVGEMVARPGEGGELVAAIREIEMDETLSEEEKARKRQELLGGKNDDVEEGGGKKELDDSELIKIIGEYITCSFCMGLPVRPITTLCGHNFCLRCFEKWIGQGKKTCAKCRAPISRAFASQPRINSHIVMIIRNARAQRPIVDAKPKIIHFVDNEDLPDEAFTTERAVKSGKANAKSGRIFVTIPKDHLGPITAEYDPVQNKGVLVGDAWKDRFACRQWGAHFPHVAGISGQAKFGAQSVVLSGGYEDDEDHGEWFLYTGSGGRDLSGNKRTNKLQSSDQKFIGGNESLRLSCRKGYPVRVIRSFKEKRSNYAPLEGVRYDGIYRIEKCWIKNGIQGFKVCRYLFVRCDNSPAPWTSDEQGDRPRPLPAVPELQKALQITERKDSPHWDFDENEGCWKWVKPQPSSMKCKEKGTRVGSKKSSKAKIMKEFSCLICHKVLTLPITTPCAHNFCKDCLDGAFGGQKFERERRTGGRQLRTQKNVMKCPSCTTDLADFLQTAQVNRELMGVIESLMSKLEENEKADGGEEESSDIVDEDEDENEDEGEDEDEEAANEEENIALDSEETKSKPVEESIASMEKPEGENENPDEAVCENTDVADKAEPPAAGKRGRKRKNAGDGTTAKPRGRKASRVTEDGNDSPSSPLHVRSDIELE